MTLNQSVFIIVGVAERRFSGISPGSYLDLWLPLADGQRLSTDSSVSWNNRQSDAAFWWLTVIGRIRPGSERKQAEAEVSAIFENEVLHGPAPLFSNSTTGVAGGGGWGSPEPPKPTPGSNSPESSENPEIRLISAQTGLTGQRIRYSNPLYVFMLAVAIILSIACANVAGLMLARTAARKQEVAVRLALGAGRLRIVRQLLTESIVLAAFGGLLGILFSYWGAHSIFAFVSSNLPRPLGYSPSVDPRVLGFTAGISLLTGILFGIAPALTSLRVDLTGAFKESEGGTAGTGRAAGRWFSVGNLLVVAQVALAVVILVGAGLLARTLRNLRNADLGFSARNLVMFNIDPSLAGYKDAKVSDIFRQLQRRISEALGISSSSYSFTPLLSGASPAMEFHAPDTAQNQQAVADMLPVGFGFFGTLHIPILAGRDFSESDFGLAAANGLAPTNLPTPVIVNEAFVHKYAGKEDPIGLRFGETPADAGSPADPGFEIVGLVRDSNTSGPRREIRPTIYGPQSHGAAWFEVRSSAGAEATVRTIRSAAAQVDPNLPLFDVRTESDQMNRLLFQERLTERLSGFFGILALTLASTGVFGLLSYEVTRRTQEIGIRMALGAQPIDVLRGIVGRGFVLAAVGAVTGIIISIDVMRFLTSFLYGFRRMTLRR